MRRLGTLIAALALALATLTSFGSGPVSATRGGGDAVTRSVVAARAEAPSKWRCGKWKGQGSHAQRYCAKFTSFKNKLDVDYRRTVHNGYKDRNLSFTCSTEKSTTWTFSASGTIEAEAGAIFAKAKASATLGVSRSATTTDGVSGTVKVKPGEYAHCKRGMFTYRFRGLVKRQVCDYNECQDVDLSSFSGIAPSRDAFFIGPGRG